MVDVRLGELVRDAMRRPKASHTPPASVTWFPKAGPRRMVMRDRMDRSPTVVEL